MAVLDLKCALEITGLVAMVTTDAKELQQRHVVCATNNWGQRESTKTTFKDCVLLLWETASQCKGLFAQTNLEETAGNWDKFKKHAGQCEPFRKTVPRYFGFIKLQMPAQNQLKM